MLTSIHKKHNIAWDKARSTNAKTHFSITSKNISVDMRISYMDSS